MVLTWRAKASISVVFLTQCVCVFVWACVHTGGAAFRMYHIVWALHSCMGIQDTQLLLIRNQSKGPAEDGIILFFPPELSRHFLPQKFAVLQDGGVPPEWEHWREYSVKVAQSAEMLVSSSSGWLEQISFVQALRYGSGFKTHLQEDQFSSSKRSAQSARCCEKDVEHLEGPY